MSPPLWSRVMVLAHLVDRHANYGASPGVVLVIGPSPRCGHCILFREEELPGQVHENQIAWCVGEDGYCQGGWFLYQYALQSITGQI